MAGKERVKVLFADPNTGICYKYPENKDDKPYVSYEEMAEYVTSRGDYILGKVKENALRKEPDQKTTLILASAFEELRHFFNDVTVWVKDASEDD